MPKNRFLQRCTVSVVVVMETEMLNEDDDDDPLLQLEEELGGDGVVYETPSSGGTGGKEGCSFNSYLQGVLYHFVAKPIVKYRFVVLGEFHMQMWKSPSRRDLHIR